MQNIMPQDPNFESQSELFLKQQENMTILINRIVKSCHSKCVSDKYHSAELEIPESVCSERCVEKYIHTYNAVTKQMGLPSF